MNVPCRRRAIVAARNEPAQAVEVAPAIPQPVAEKPKRKKLSMPK
jgi:hypothetical protein